MLIFLILPNYVEIWKHYFRLPLSYSLSLLLLFTGLTTVCLT